MSHEWKEGDTARRKRSMYVLHFDGSEMFIPAGFEFSVAQACNNALFDGKQWHDKIDCEYILPKPTPEIDAKIAALGAELRAEFTAKLAEIAKPEPASEPVEWAVGDIAMETLDGYCFEVRQIEGPYLLTGMHGRFLRKSCVQLYSAKCGTLSETIQHIKEAIK